MGVKQVKQLLHLFGLSTTLRFNGKYFINEIGAYDVDNRARTLESTRVFYIVPKFHEFLVYKRLKTVPQFLPTLSVLFRRQSIVHALSGINGESK